MSGVRQRFLPQPLTSAWLLAVWLLANNTLAPGHLLLGSVLAVGVPLLTARFWPEHPASVRYRPLARLMVVVLFDIVIANLTVARLILDPTRRLRSRFFDVPVELQTPFATTLLASIISLTPGTVSSDLGADGRSLLVHGLDVADEAATVNRIKTRYERPLKEIFEC